jgi:DNA-binding GntR family transcriptional regulator
MPTPEGGAMPDIAPIDNAPLRIQVADMIRRAIINGTLRPGTPLVETALAEQMNVSRAPVREAIQLLESDGLVETIAYKGKRVKPLTATEIEEIYSLREAFEVLAVRRILERGADPAPLRAPCEAMAKAAARGDYEALIAADEAFHRTLIGLSEHGLLLASWNSLYLRIHQIMALRNRAGADLAQIAANHPPIVDALEARDTDRAVRLIAEHTRALARLDPAGIAEGAP